MNALTKQGSALAALKGLEEKQGVFQVVETKSGFIGDLLWKEVEDQLQKSETARAIVGTGRHAKCVLWNSEARCWVGLDQEVRQQQLHIVQNQSNTINGLFGETSETFEAIVYDVRTEANEQT